MAAGLFTLKPPVAQDRRVVCRWVLENPSKILPGNSGSKTGCLNQHFPLLPNKIHAFDCLSVCMCVHVCICIHMSPCDVCAHTISASCEVKRQLQEVVLSFHHESPRDHTQVGLAAIPLPTEPLHPSTSPFLSLLSLPSHHESGVRIMKGICGTSRSFHRSVTTAACSLGQNFPITPVLWSAPHVRQITSCSCATTVGGLWSPCQSAFYTQSWLPDPNPLLPSPSSHSLCSRYHLLSHTFVAGSCWAKQQFAVIYAA